jgi:phage terminase large subunit-like protein
MCTKYSCRHGSPMPLPQGLYQQLDLLGTAGPSNNVVSAYVKCHRIRAPASRVFCLGAAMRRAYTCMCIGKQPLLGITGAVWCFSSAKLVSRVCGVFLLQKLECVGLTATFVGIQPPPCLTVRGGCLYFQGTTAFEHWNLPQASCTITLYGKSGIP